MGLITVLRTLTLVSCLTYCAALTPLSAVGDDNDCALYLSGPGRTSAYDYTLNLLKGNFGYEGQHTCITYDAVNRAYLEARNRIVVAQPKGEWKPEDYASVGELVLDISTNLARTYGLTYEEIEKGLPLIDTSRTLIREVCPPVFSHVECRAGKYRRLDGLCNNLQHPTWGATNAPFQRLIGPLFADGMNAPRVGHTGRDLPLSRVVSRTMHPDEGFHDHAGTVMVIAWGQFMDHDYTLTGTPLDPRNRNDPEECCKRPPHLKHPYCDEIRIPDDDYFYRLWGVKCIDFVRAFPSPRPGCKLGSRIPFNTLTGVLDGNTVYGVTDKFARKLRMGHGGLLRMNPAFREYGLKDLLPLKLDIPDEGCTRPDKNMYCFEAGEIRVNEQLVLTVMHTLMAREHNRIAEALTAVNPHWDDETLYQEARRINIAEIQHITYNEFLPILLGKDVMEKFGLVLNKHGYWDGYDTTVNPDVIASFASAAYRFGHSLLPTAVERWSKAHKFIASKRLSDLIRRPFDLYRAGVLDEYVMGLMNQVAQAMDDSITQEVTNHLFKKPGARFGMDLVSFNMQRGREFGIPGYMEFRKFCGLPGAETFEELFGSMPNETVYKYKSIFEHPIDVDLWSGGVSERPLPGSMLGPTFACIIATQFSYSRRGDRFWFELPHQPSSFTPEQLAEIRKSRLARIICDNTDIIDTTQLYPFVLPDHELNPRVPCRSGIIPSMDFSKWAEPVPFHQGAKHFDTEAIYGEKFEANCATPIDNNDTNITNSDCGCNDATTAVKTEDGVINNEYRTHADENNLKIKANDTYLELFLNVTDQPTNVLKRTKRSKHVYNHLKYADKFPLLRYKVLEKPEDISIDKQASHVVNTAALADYNIQTLHAPYAKQPASNSANHFRNPVKNQDVSNDSGDYLAKTISKPFVATPEIVAPSAENVKSNENTSSKNEDVDINKEDEQNNKIYKSNNGENIDSDESRERNSDEITDSSRNSESNEKDNYKKEQTSSESEETSAKGEESNSRSGELNDLNTEKVTQRKNRYVLKKILKRPVNGGSTENKEGTYPDIEHPYRKNNKKSSSEENVRENGFQDADIPISETSREDVGDDVPEHRSLEEDSSITLKPVQYKFISKERKGDRDFRKSGESEYPQRPYRGKKENYIDDSPRYTKPTPHQGFEYKESKADYRPLNSWYPKKVDVNKLNHDVELFTENKPGGDKERPVIFVMKKNKKVIPNPYPKRLNDIQDVDIRDLKQQRIRVDPSKIKQPIGAQKQNLKQYHDSDVRPVKEIEREKVQGSKVGKQNSQSEDEGNASLETVLGITNPDGSSEAVQSNEDNEDAKEEVERIPTSYNHNPKALQKNEERESAQPIEATTQFDIDETLQNLGLTHPTTERYDENLNIKFNEDPLVLPKIKLPEDVLSFGREETEANESDENKPNQIQLASGEERHDENSARENSGEEEESKEEDQNNSRNEDDNSSREENHNSKHDSEEDDHNNRYLGHDRKLQKINDKKRGSSEENHDDGSFEEEEDLYEKFVRERFGKTGNFRKRSEKLLDSRPPEFNDKLRKVIKKTENIDKEAANSEDPNAGYLWTLEYDRNL